MKVARSDQHVASSNIFEHFCTVLLKSAPWTMDVKHEGFPWIFQKGFFHSPIFNLSTSFFEWKKAHPLQQKNRFCCSRYEGGSNKN